MFNFTNNSNTFENLFGGLRNCAHTKSFHRLLCSFARVITLHDIKFFSTPVNVRLWTIGTFQGR
jgi:hypothetical protein